MYVREARQEQLMLMHLLVVALDLEGWRMAPQQFEMLRRELKTTPADVVTRYGTSAATGQVQAHTHCHKSALLCCWVIMVKSFMGDARTADTVYVSLSTLLCCWCPGSVSWGAAAQQCASRWPLRLQVLTRQLPRRTTSHCWHLGPKPWPKASQGPRF